MEKKLPVYKMIVDGEEATVFKTSFVKDPAYMRAFMAFDNQKKVQYFANDEQRIVTGVMLVPDLPIYRRDPDGTEYYVVADKDTIKLAAHAYLKNGFAKSVNLEHNQNQNEVAGVYMAESFVTDSVRGMNTPVGFDPQPDGTWFASFKVDNDEVWQKVKSGAFTGFSIEGIFELQKTTDSPESQLQRVIDVLNTLSKINTPVLYSKDTKEKQITFMKNLFEALNGLRKTFKMEEVQPIVFGEATLKDGTIVKWEGELQPGVALIAVMPEGEVPAPDGSHELEDGTVLTVVGGLVTEIVAPEGFANQIKPYESRLKSLEDLLKGTLEVATKQGEAFAAVTKENTSLKKTIDEQNALNKQVAETLIKLQETEGDDPGKKKQSNKFAGQAPDKNAWISSVVQKLQPTE